MARVALDIERRPAREAKELGFVPRALVQANLPYRRVEETTFSRRAGKLRLHLQTPPGIGLPYGRYPRLLLAWVATEAVRTREPRLELGRSLSSFLRRIGVAASGGARGPIRRVREQMKRLFATTVSVSWETEGAFAVEGLRIARSSYLWWDPVEDEAAAGPGSRVTLSLDFFNEILAAPVPVDLRALRALTSPLALDVYCWLSYRSFNLRREVHIPWRRLHEQFGTQNRQLAGFRRSFRTALEKVLVLYPGARVRYDPRRLVLRPPAGTAVPAATPTV